MTSPALSLYSEISAKFFLRLSSAACDGEAVARRLQRRVGRRSAYCLRGRSGITLRKNSTVFDNMSGYLSIEP